LLGRFRDEGVRVIAIIALTKCPRENCIARDARNGYALFEGAMFFIPARRLVLFFAKIENHNEGAGKSA